MERGSEVVTVVAEGATNRVDQVFSVRINLLFYLFFIVVPSNTCVFLSCMPFVVNTTFSTGLVCIEVSSVSWLGQLTVF